VHLALFRDGEYRVLRSHKICVCGGFGGQEATVRAAARVSRIDVNVRIGNDRLPVCAGVIFEVEIVLPESDDQLVNRTAMKWGGEGGNVARRT
jgi:hypothetical protein